MGECCICYEECHTLRKTNCNHYFCKECYVKITHCTLCRVKLVKYEVEYLQKPMKAYPASSDAVLATEYNRRVRLREQRERREQVRPQQLRFGFEMLRRFFLWVIYR